MSGTGYVAEGVMFRSGQCAVSWRSDHSSVNIYKSLEDVIFVHGHSGSTEIEFIDNEDDPERTAKSIRKATEIEEDDCN